MKIIKSLGEIKKNVVLTIGNFDGVHAGHRSFLEQIKQRAIQDGGTGC
jgi:FAD synthase